MKLFGIISLITSVFVELSYRISYSTGKTLAKSSKFNLNLDIFAACLIAHLSHIVNTKWVPKFDDYVNSKLIRQWAIGKWADDRESRKNKRKEENI